MTKVRFISPVFYEGRGYAAGEVYNLDATSIKVLGDSVEPAAANDEPSVDEDAHQDVTVTVDLLKVKPDTDKKAVNAPAKDKMVKQPSTKK